MMPPVHRATDVRLGLPSRAGAMAALFAAFDTAGLAVHGICALADEAGGGVHVLVADTDAGATVAAARRAGAGEVRQRPVAVIEVGQLRIPAAEVFRRIADAGGDIDLLYGATNGALVIGLADESHLPAVMAAFEAAG